jgi:chromatin segregation and condensation protein Rec8/ScpA/Scc1 (kleisin family)
MSYEVFLSPLNEGHPPQFEGPLDLLLYLVQKNELNLKTISISEITDQYLAYIEKIQQTDLGSAGDFLYMASRLMLMKARELLPRTDDDIEGDEEFWDPDREEFIKQMLEYQKFKEAGNTLKQFENQNIGAFYRGRLERARKQENEDAPYAGQDGLFELYKAFRNSMRTRIATGVHTIELDNITVEDRIQVVENYLQQHGRAMFEDVIGRDTRPVVIVVTFMALLEMTKLGQIIVRQSDTFGVLWIYRKKNNLEYAEEMKRDIRITTRDPDLQPNLAALLRKRTDAKEGIWEASLDNVMREATRRVNAGETITEATLDELLEIDEVLPELANDRVEVCATHSNNTAEPEYKKSSIMLHSFSLRRSQKHHSISSRSQKKYLPKGKQGYFS